jgi:cytochrome c6
LANQLNKKVKEMKIIISALLLTTCLYATTGLCDTRKGEKIDGKKEFEEHCSVCHPNGGNIVNAHKTLGYKSLRSNGVKNVKDIISKIRNPGPGMTRFDKKTISNNEAKAVAEYILKSFK